MSIWVGTIVMVSVEYATPGWAGVVGERNCAGRTGSTLELRTGFHNRMHLAKKYNCTVQRCRSD
jgi:hypothetical protein